MFRLIAMYAGVVVLVFAASSAAAGNSTAKCENIEKPFQLLVQLTLDPAVGNPPRVALCHRAANSFKHFQKGRSDKAISELEKYVKGVEGSSGKRVDGAYAKGLISEAQRVIAILSGEPAAVTKTITGGVFSFDTQLPAAGATVTVLFPSSGATYTTSSGEDGLFAIEDLADEGVFIASASTSSGATGTAQGSLLETEPNASVSLVVDSAGAGTIQGIISDDNGQPVSGALVTIVFPDTGRKYSTSTMADGSYSLNNLQTDGTVIVIGFEDDTGANASTSEILTQNSPSLTLNLALQSPEIVNPELLNGTFANGLQGWSTSGSVELVDRNTVFSTPE